MIELSKALCLAQSKFKDIKKDTKGQFGKYADLPTIWAAIRPVLTECGLSVCQLATSDNEGRIGVTTILMHSSGESVSGTIYVPVDVTTKGASHIQKVGANLSYLRRFGLSAALSLTTDEDADGADPRPAPLTDGDVATRLSWCETADDCRALYAELKSASATERQLEMVAGKGKELKGAQK